MEPSNVSEEKSRKNTSAGSLQASLPPRPAYPELEELRIGGAFPMILKVDPQVLPVSPRELTNVLEHAEPITFSGQRTPIYRLGESVFLKAKGFAYRKRVYSEYREYTLTQRLPLSTELAKRHGLRMQQYGRPEPVRFLEESGDYEYPVAEPDGSFRFERSAPRPIAAMRLENAGLEYFTHYCARQAGFPVDLPLGYAEFPEFKFVHDGQNIPCGGFLSLIPTPLDLRIPEILHLAASNEAVAEMYAIGGANRTELLLESLKQAGLILRHFHNASMTLSTPHFINFKLGNLNYDLTVRMHDETGSPLVSICDLDNVRLEENKESSLVYLGNMVRDLEELCLFAYYFFVSGPQREKALNRKLSDDQRCMRSVSALLPEELGLSGTREPLNSIFAGYFGIPGHPVLNLLMPTLKDFKKNLKRRGDPLLELLKAFHADRLRLPKPPEQALVDRLE